MSRIELKNVSFTYGGGTSYEIKALDDVSITFEEGIVTGLIGHTGSGKSTLVQLLNGLLKPDSGEIILDGENIWDKPKEIRKVRFKVGLVMQYPEHQLFDETVRSDIAYGPRNMGMTKDEIDAAVKDAVSFIGLDESLLDKSPFDLSGGQKRRAALCGVVAMRPGVLVLDEPAAGLDPGGRREILSRIKDFSRSSGATLILVTHSMEDMAIYCDHVAVLAHGRVAFEGSCAEVFSRADELISLGLDVPEINRTALALEARGIDVGRDVYTVKYAFNKLMELSGKAVRYES